ncbi:MAG: ATP-binding protein [Chitinophagales bacterium]|nr:ATP-binding protein [Chitinophagales bacterium]
MIERVLKSRLQEHLFSGKAILLMGPRQVGKTTLLKSAFENLEDILWLNGDELDVAALFSNVSATRLRQFLGNKKVIVIDEAQRITDIGLRLKLITDTLPDIQLIATGSSSFELANQVNEPLTGRKWEYKMYPISFAEMVMHHGLLEEKRSLNHRLVYGSYPEVITHIGQEKDILKQLTDSFLYKDVLLLEQIKKPEKIVKLLQALAFQIGSQVSYSEIGQIIGMDSKTVEKYIQILEQSYVIFRLGSFSRNLRNELKNSKKIYFYDNGVRNALIANFEIAETRSDIGGLWENYLVSERIKKLAYDNIWANNWFWRTKEQKEIDYIEEKDGKMTGYEFKWSPKAKVKVPSAFIKSYKSDFKVITPQNYEDFLL